jgi:hypothetical protein
MKKIIKEYEGRIEKVASNKIFLNINNLEKGIYKLKIVHKNKIIKSVHFTKE